MSVPLYPKLEPRTVEIFWYSPDEGKNDILDINQIEHEHQTWIDSINDRCKTEVPLGTPIEAPTPDEDDEDDDDDDDEEEEETDESHDNDNEDAAFNNGSINGEIIQITTHSTEPNRNRVNRSTGQFLH